MTHLSVRSERTLVCAKTGGSRHVAVCIGAPRIEGSVARLAMNLAFVLDRSGSMAGGRLELAKGAVGEALRRLTEIDRFSVVAYDSEVQVTVPSMVATAENVSRARDAIRPLRPGGATALYDGWTAGCREVAANRVEGQAARCLLFTDGRANKGETAPDVLAGHAVALRTRGVATSTFGIGHHFDEHLLGRLADAGGGNARFIEAPSDFSSLIAAELQDALDIVHPSLVLRVTVSDGVAVEVIGPWRTQVLGTQVDIHLGDLVSEELLDLVIGFHLPPGKPDEGHEISFSLLDREGPVDSEHPTASWRCVSEEENTAQPRNVEVDRLVASRHAARARERAVLANRDGNFELGADILHGVMAQVERYVGSDPELISLLRDLRRDARRYSAPMTAMDQKQEYYGTTSTLRGRARDGSAKRR